MCQYAYVTYRCGHGELLAGPNCETLMYELSRIHREPSAWTPAGQETIPFLWPESCSPTQHNTTGITSGNWCGWECRNSHSADTASMYADTEALGEQTEHIDAIENSYYSSDAGRMPWYFDYSGPNIVDSYTYMGDFAEGAVDGYLDDLANDIADSYVDSLVDGVVDGVMDFADAGVGANAVHEILDSDLDGLMDDMEDRFMGGANATLGESEVVFQEGTEEAEDHMAITYGTELGFTATAETQGLMGMSDAEYGRPRLGVGWRNDDSGVEYVRECDWMDDGKVFK
ncbi:hypothetical protein F5Y13DRAFT_202028 [Hypoxylon sp. FL1857]|nr:hypothetical protein F5Y13DRAFT_202028 [Hypoxylon sp. FL1857]